MKKYHILLSLTCCGLRRFQELRCHTELVHKHPAHLAHLEEEYTVGMEGGREGEREGGREGSGEGRV